MPALIQLETELSSLLDQIDQDFAEGREPSTELVRMAEHLTTSVEEKRDQYAFAVRRLNSEVGFIEAEIERLRDLQKRRERIVLWMKQQALQAMEKHDIKKLSGLTSTFTRVRNQDHVRVFSVDDLPSEYVRETVTREPKKAELAKALKAGKVVRGAILESGEWRLQIR